MRLFGHSRECVGETLLAHDTHVTHVSVESV